MRTAVVVLLMLAALAAAGCGSSSNGNSLGSASAPTTNCSLAKTKFVLHAGLAFGAFHRWIYKPFRAGDFNHPFSHKLSFIKGLLAGAFVIHEARIALADARCSKLLSRVVLPLTALGSAVALITAAIHAHHVNAADVNSANSSVAQASSASSAAGQPIKETTAGAGI